MAQKKTLSKNRKRKLLKKLFLAKILIDHFVQQKIKRDIPKLTPGAIMSEIKPWIHPEPVTPFFHRIHNLHPELLETLKAANPGETIIGYRNEDGEIAIKLKPKPVQEHMFANINIKDERIEAANEFYNHHMNNSFQPKY